MQTGTEQQQSKPENHEENRNARAEAIADVIAEFSRRTGIPASELVNKADYHDWQMYLLKSYERLPIASAKSKQPSEATKALVRTLVKRDVRVSEEAKKNIHTQDSDCAGSIDPQTMMCGVCHVDHSGECPVCHGHGYHLDGCSEIEEQPSKEVH